MKAGHYGRERTTAEFRASADIAAARPAIATTRPATASATETA